MYKDQFFKGKKGNDTKEEKFKFTIFGKVKHYDSKGRPTSHQIEMIRSNPQYTQTAQALDHCANYFARNPMADTTLKTIIQIFKSEGGETKIAYMLTTVPQCKEAVVNAFKNHYLSAETQEISPEMADEIFSICGNAHFELLPLMNEVFGKEKVASYMSQALTSTTSRFP